MSGIYEVEKIVQAKMQRGRMLYQVRWKGYSAKESTWEPEANLDGCQVLLNEFKSNATNLQENPESLSIVNLQKSPPLKPRKRSRSHDISNATTADENTENSPDTALSKPKPKNTRKRLRANVSSKKEKPEPLPIPSLANSAPTEPIQRLQSPEPIPDFYGILTRNKIKHILGLYQNPDTGKTLCLLSWKKLRTGKTPMNSYYPIIDVRRQEPRLLGEFLSDNIDQT